MFEWCRTSEVKYMGGWHRVSNKNQPRISSIKFLKSRGVFYSRTTSTYIESFVELSHRRHHLSKGCLKKIRLVKLFLRVFYNFVVY